jgi:hypothetical protein
MLFKLVYKGFQYLSPLPRFYNAFILSLLAWHEVMKSGLISLRASLVRHEKYKAARIRIIFIK